MTKRFWGGMHFSGSAIAAQRANLSQASSLRSSNRTRLSQIGRRDRNVLSVATPRLVSICLGAETASSRLDLSGSRNRPIYNDQS
ncbi:hypothetical protein PUN28_012013 [Cardiocondyla obscurior]|uniref:Uncharacterized protein n=1 Tax=Cardiocondyla obscurior TaxID=286306 RepID=A0AAW2FCV0_9HYME